MNRVYRTFAVLFEVGDEVVVATDLMVCSCSSMMVEPRLSLDVTLKKGHRVFAVDLHSFMKTECASNAVSSVGEKRSVYFNIRFGDEAFLNAGLSVLVKCNGERKRVSVCELISGNRLIKELNSKISVNSVSAAKVG